MLIVIRCHQSLRKPQHNLSSYLSTLLIPGRVLFLIALSWCPPIVNVSKVSLSHVINVHTFKSVISSSKSG